MIPLDPTCCPECGAVLAREVVAQPALFYFGGYGATTETLVRYCRCGWALEASVQAVRP